jgi:hypothetical protein
MLLRSGKQLGAVGPCWVGEADPAGILGLWAHPPECLARRLDDHEDALMQPLLSV